MTNPMKNVLRLTAIVALAALISGCHYHFHGGHGAGFRGGPGFQGGPSAGFQGGPAPGFRPY